MKIRFASAGRAVVRRSAATARQNAELLRNRESLRALVGARDDEYVGGASQVFPRGGFRVRGRDGPDDRGVALDVVEAEAVDLRAQELARHPRVRLEADRE